MDVPAWKKAVRIRRSSCHSPTAAANPFPAVESLQASSHRLTSGRVAESFPASLVAHERAQPHWRSSTASLVGCQPQRAPRDKRRRPARGCPSGTEGVRRSCAVRTTPRNKHTAAQAGNRRTHIGGWAGSTSAVKEESRSSAAGSRDHSGTCAGRSVPNHPSPLAASRSCSLFPLPLGYCTIPQSPSRWHSLWTQSELYSLSCPHEPLRLFPAVPSDPSRI